MPAAASIRALPLAAALLWGHGVTVADPAASTSAGYLYGRVTTTEGVSIEGHLRWGGDEEAFWSEYFNGARAGNRWADQVPEDRLRRTEPVRFLGMTLGERRRPLDLKRPFMVRFGEIDWIEADGRELTVRLRSGTRVELDRYGADDFADGLVVRKADGTTVSLDEWSIRRVQFLPSVSWPDAPRRLHGTVLTSAGTLMGHLQWDRQYGVATDALRCRDGTEVPLGDVQWIERNSEDRASVRIAGDRDCEVALDARSFRGVYVHDDRFGRVSVPTRAFRRLDLSPSVGSGPAFSDLGQGRVLRGAVHVIDGNRIVGRLVFDLDESETVETLDAPVGEITYSIPFERVLAIVPGAADACVEVTLVPDQRLCLERVGDLGAENAGMLVFPDDRSAPIHVAWPQVARIDLTPNGSGPVE